MEVSLRINLIKEGRVERIIEKCNLVLIELNMEFVFFLYFLILWFNVFFLLFKVVKVRLYILFVIKYIK